MNTINLLLGMELRLGGEGDIANLLSSIFMIVFCSLQWYFLLFYFSGP